MPAVVSPALAAAERELLALLHADARLSSIRSDVEYPHEQGEEMGLGVWVNIDGDAEMAEQVSDDLYDLAAEVERRHGLRSHTIGIVVLWV